MRKSVGWLVVCLSLLFVWAVAASAMQLQFEGNFGNKLQISNWNAVNDYDLWAESQLRLGGLASTEDGKVKALWEMEVGTVTYGDADWYFATDSRDIEMRMGYVDFQIPTITTENRIALGLQEVEINKWLLAEIIPAIRNYGSFETGNTKVTYEIGWAREEDNGLGGYWNLGANDADLWFVKGEISPTEQVDLSGFFIYKNDSINDEQPWWIGGEVSVAPIQGLEVSGDFIYEGGDAANNGDISGYFVALSGNYEVTPELKVSGLFWYASGDDDPTDSDVENYEAIETDTFGSVIFFEDATFDDVPYISTNPYLNDLGLWLIRGRVDYKVTPKFSVAGAIGYLQYAEDDALGNSYLGTELDFYAKYALYEGLDASFIVGYLINGEVLDDLNYDNLYRVTFGVTYSF